MNKESRLSVFASYLLLLASSFLLLASDISAQEISLSIFPSLVEFTIRPGQSVTQAYQIVNQSEIDLYLQPIIVPFRPVGTKGEIELTSPKYQPAVISYFSLNNSDLDLGQTFKLSANSQKQLVLKIDLPENAPERDHYLTLLFEQSAERKFVGDNSGGQNLITLGSNILLVSIDSLAPQLEGSVIEFKTKPKVGDLFSPIFFKILIQNTGSSFLKTGGEIKIKNLLTKKEVPVLDLRPDNILTDSSREIVCLSSSKELGIETTANQQTTECSFSSWVPGAYQATLSFSKTSGIDPLKTTVTFWLLPIKAGLALLILIIVVYQVGRTHLGKIAKTKSPRTIPPLGDQQGKQITNKPQ